MDNSKIGSFIKTLRHKRGLTQKELAERLHITDRAVSKWERGLSAPDIALLEPLAELLDVTVGELIRGERQPEPPQDTADQNTDSILDYAKADARQKQRAFRKRYLWTALYSLIALLILAGLWLWHSGTLFTVSRSTSPGGSYTATVYSRDYLSFRPWEGQEAMLCVQGNETPYRSYASFPTADSYQLWWSPDGEKFVLEAGDYLGLTDLEAGMHANLNVRLTYAPEALHLPTDDRSLQWHFLQWGEDSERMLIYYTGDRSGYFWYNYRTGEFSGHITM